MVRISVTNTVPAGFVKNRFLQNVPKVSGFAWQYFVFRNWLGQCRFIKKLDNCKFIYWDGIITDFEINVYCEKERIIQVLRLLPNFCLYIERQPTTLHNTDYMTRTDTLITQMIKYDVLPTRQSTHYGPYKY